ncbi:MAG: hypothetical protein K1X78_02165 [Verrucomicrobiaceae bacterium]|nr:hypothetical protein [Verrucomicrobiaceae bacterium]
MSRISGITHPQPPTEAAKFFAFGTPAGGSVHRIKREGAGLAWAGFGAPRAATRGSFGVVLDGIIYNASELAAGKPDAEVILDLFERFGFTGMLERLNGDFALALFDEKEQTLWLARDRFGAKPLYYTASSPWGFAFASRCGALLALPGVSSAPVAQYVALMAASHYRHFDNEPEKSPYKDIAQLPAAHWLRFKGGQVTTGTYWQLHDLPDWDEPAETLALRYRDLLLDATRLRIARCGKAAFTLSGGMDSSSVLSSAVKVTGQKQHAVSSVYEDKTFDESEDIQTILSETVSQWHQVNVSDPDVFSLVAKMVAAHDEPVATATWLSHFLVVRQASESGFTHLFGGLGGDELNAGEYEHFFFFFADLKQAGQFDKLRHEVNKWVEYHDHPIHRKSYAVMEGMLLRSCDLAIPGRCLADRARMTRYADALNPGFFDLRAFEPRMPHTFTSYLKTRTYQDIFLETSPCCLRAQDRQGMAHGIEHVMPFFDHRLVEFMFRVPGTLKVRDGVTKTLLREAMKGIVPDTTRTRIKKTGWNAPGHLWFSGKGREKLLDLVHSAAFRSRGIYDVARVEELIEEHEQIVSQSLVKENHMMFLWQLVNLEMWLGSSIPQR